MHSRWIAAGNPSEIAVYPGGLHAFNNADTELARTANDRRIEAIRSWTA
jgi:acetyl esterase